MSIRTTNVISYFFAGISILLIIIGCFAPIVFTQCRSLVDFTETGQIGDTIGGTMSPFVTIAGVLMTFIAFLMQVNANKIQSDQLRKSLSLKLLENKIDSRNALELMSVDINVMIKNIDAICQEIEKFCKATEGNPTGEIPFHFTPKQSYGRYASINRNLVYNAFASFMMPDEYLEDFRTTYSLMDFYCEGLNSLFSVIYKPYMDDIMTIKKQIPSAFDELNNALNDYAYNFRLMDLINLFNKNVKERLINNGVLNVLELKKVLDDARFSSLFQANFVKYQTVLALTNSLITQNMMMVGAMRDAKAKFQEQGMYNRLKSLRDTIEVVLSKHTIKTIETEFVNQADLFANRN